jgi:transposase-like protein
MKRAELSIPKLAAKIATEADAYKFLEDLRWNGKPVCPHCASPKSPYFLKPKNGTTRKTRTGSASERRVWKCAECRKQFSALTGSIFHGSKIPVRTWLFIVFEMCSSKNGVSAREIERKYDLTPKSAWFALQRIREAMKRGPLSDLLSGRVVADESWYGGEPKNRHGYDPKKGKQGKTDKTPILTLVCRETGEVRSRAIPNVTGDTLSEAIRDNVDAARTHLQTDEWHGYWHVAPLLAGHSTVNHREREYARGDVTTNHAENFFSQLKRSLDGTHHHVSRVHLDRYLSEFDFRFSTRKLSDTERMKRLAGQVGGKRLTYRPAT